MCDLVISNHYGDMRFESLSRPHLLGEMYMKPMEPSIYLILQHSLSQIMHINSARILRIWE